MALSALGPYGGLLAGLVLGALGFPLPEELVLLAAGAAAHRGLASPGHVLAVAVLAVAATDALVFALDRRFGPAVVSRAPTGWLLPPRRAPASRASSTATAPSSSSRRASCPASARPPSCSSGAHGMPVRRFLACDTLGIALGVPAMLALGYLASSSIARIAASFARVEHVLALAAALAVTIAVLASAVRALRG